MPSGTNIKKTQRPQRWLPCEVLQRKALQTPHLPLQTGVGLGSGERGLARWAVEDPPPGPLAGLEGEDPQD